MNNITGMAVFNATLAGKRIELTKELLPTAAVMGYLLNPADQMSAIESKGALVSARALGIELKVLNASSEDGLNFLKVTRSPRYGCLAR